MAYSLPSRAGGDLPGARIVYIQIHPILDACVASHVQVNARGRPTAHLPWQKDRPRERSRRREPPRGFRPFEASGNYI